MRAPPAPRIGWLIVALALSPAEHAAAQQPDSAWDVTRARGRTREIDFVTREGTWMSSSVSPDGRWVVFDMLAHIYRVPIAGGEAESLTQNSGVAVNFHPRFSPDGRHIAFISDRRGQTNLWVMNADGSNPRPVFTSPTIRAVEPTWSADGQYIIVRRSQVGGGGGGGGGLWMYHRDGGEGVQVVPSTVQGASWPSASRDGKYVYFQEQTPGQAVTWLHDDDDDPILNDALLGGYQIRRLELRTNAITPVTSGSASRQYRLSSGGAYAGEVSPDGRWLAFARRIPDGTIVYKGHEFGPRTALWLRDLQTGHERVLMDPIEQDMAEGMKVSRVLPGYSWMPDGQSIVIAAGGKLRRLDVRTGTVTTIPFTVRVRRTISEQARAEFRIPDDPFTVKFTRWQTASADGRRLAFQAIGKIWVMDVPPRGQPSQDGSQGGPTQPDPPRRLTSTDFSSYEYGPAWSPDGQWIAFTTVDRNNEGHLWRVRANGGTPERLTTESAEYAHPAFSHDGRDIVFARGAGASLRNSTVAHSAYYDLMVMPTAGGAATVVTRVVGQTLPSRSQFVRPTLAADGRIYFPQITQGEGRSSTTRLVSLQRDGTDPLEHLSFPAADEIVPSPDGRWAAFNEGDNIYVVPMTGSMRGAQVVSVEKRRGSLPVKQISREGGIFPRWRDNETLELGNGAQYIAYHVGTGRADTVRINLQVPRAMPQGTIAVTGARIITLEDGRVIERGTIVATRGRITCVGSCSTRGADRVIDASGKTIIPGFVDMHSHHFREYRGIIPPQAFEASIPLAFGVTTSMDNSMWSQDVFPAAEMIEAGVLVGPRVFSTGDPLYAGDAARRNELTSYKVAEENIVRLQTWGAVGLKQYLQPRRDQRQWVSDIARKHGLMVTAEGDNLEYNLGMIMDGQTGWEHPLSLVPLYSDATTFFGKSRTTYSPTFNVGGPGPWNDEFFFGESDVWKNEKLRLWMPWQQLVPHSRRRVLRPATDYSYPLLAQQVADIIAQGGHGAIGSHGQQHGIASHWEVWMAASAMGPMGALELASKQGSIFLGAERDVGSIAVGKLADLIVLNSNPLQNIRNTADIRWVMKGGVLYDGMALDEVWPQARPYGPRPWINKEALNAGPRAADYWDRKPQ
ncbi:MAG: amidohydrolase family protein [Gemmatimonadaceae bacterium]